MHRTRVGVLRGGPSSEYEVSLGTGASVLRHLNEEKYEPIDVFIDKEGVWHVRGLPMQPRRILESVDVVFNAMHGEYGEDGTVQKLFEAFGTPYVGSRPIPSAIALNKLLTKQQVRAQGIVTPRHMVADDSDDPARLADDIFHTLAQPVVVKPIARGSSVGVSVAHGPEAIRHALQEAQNISPKVLVEEHVAGREATCGVLEHFRGEELYALPSIEITPPQSHRFFDYDAKYNGETLEQCPGNFSYEEKEQLADVARRVHHALGLRHHSRSDFIVSPKGIYFLEVNTLPGLTPGSLFPKAVEAVGCSFPDFLDHLISLAHGRR